MAYINGRGALMALRIDVDRQGLIAKANGVMGTEERDLESAVDLLAKGYGNDPIPYDVANEGDKLYTAYFASGNFIPVDDAETPFIEGGTTYLADGSVSEEIPLTQWRRHLVENPNTMESKTLIIKGEDTTATDHRFIGHFPEYDLENKTYTLEFEFFRKSTPNRHRFYFANGTFVNENGGVITGNDVYPASWKVPTNCGCDASMPCLAFELNKYNSQIGYKLYRQSSGVANDAVIFNHGTVDFKTESTGEFVANMKVVLKGGAKKNVTLYDGYGVVTGSTPNRAYWVGDVIPIEFTIYHNIDGNDMRVSAGHIYQPADNIGLVFGIGNYDTLANGEYYGIRNLSIYKGDRTKIDYGNSPIVEIFTAEEMNALLNSATDADVGKFYMYVGETTDAYENGALYKIGKTDTVTFKIYDYTSESYVFVGTADVGTKWGDFATAHTADGFLYESTVSFEGSAIYDGKTVISPDDEIRATTYGIN